MRDHLRDLLDEAHPPEPGRPMGERIADACGLLGVMTVVASLVVIAIDMTRGEPSPAVFTLWGGFLLHLAAIHR